MLFKVFQLLTRYMGWCGLILYGKSDPPPAPDYVAAANATAAGNLDAARYSTKANRINQVNPYGTLTYQQDGSDPDRWTQTQTLSPTAQDTVDRQIGLSNDYAQIAQTGLERARGTLENPQLDISALPERPINVGQTAQDAILSRLNPQFNQQEEAMRARLANQGITLGSEAYGRETDQLGRQRNDATMQAALQGINLDQANRGAALQEQAYLQDRPLNLINALRTGAQVQNPQFQQFAQQQTTAGPNLLGAAQAQYGADLDAYNAEQANDPLGGLFSIGMGLAGLPVVGGGSLGGNAIKGLFSDRRLKRNIRKVGTLDSGLNVYAYRYVWGGPEHIGVMADEVEKVNPGAVFEVAGFKAVDYGRI